MLVPGGLKVLGAYGAASVGAGTADQLRAAQALLSSVPSQLVCRPGCSLMLYQGCGVAICREWLDHPNKQHRDHADATWSGDHSKRFHFWLSVMSMGRHHADARART